MALLPLDMCKGKSPGYNWAGDSDFLTHLKHLVTHKNLRLLLASSADGSTWEWQSEYLDDDAGLWSDMQLLVKNGQAIRVLGPTNWEVILAMADEVGDRWYAEHVYLQSLSIPGH